MLANIKKGEFKFMKKNLTELVIIIDKSGSMHGLENDVIGGFNALIEEQKKLEGEVKVTLVFFNDDLELVYNRVNIINVKKLEKEDYHPQGCTALLDAIGLNIISTKILHNSYKEDDVPEHTIFSIMTDGLENSSKEYSYKEIKKLISSQKEKGWDFLFQAANIDAFEEGYNLGISKEDIQEFAANHDGIKMCMAVCGAAISNKRKTKSKK